VKQAHGDSKDGPSRAVHNHDITSSIFKATKRHEIRIGYNFGWCQKAKEFYDMHFADLNLWQNLRIIRDRETRGHHDKCLRVAVH
jgi:hypothetical protein